MTISLKRIQAIIKKDWKDLQKNSYILITILLPLGLAFMIKRMVTEDSSMMLAMPINVALVMTGAFVQASMMAEEKEKSTLRTLLLSPASITEILIGKSSLSAIITLVVMAASIWISGIAIPEFFYFSIMILLSLIIFISMGTIIGLLSRTVMETSVVGLPVLLIFTYGSMLTTFIDHPIASQLISYLPTENLSAALSSLAQDEGFSTIKWNLLNIAAWAIISIAAAIFVYRKRRFDK